MFWFPPRNSFETVYNDTVPLLLHTVLVFGPNFKVNRQRFQNFLEEPILSWSRVIVKIIISVLKCILAVWRASLAATPMARIKYGRNSLKIVKCESSASQKKG